MSSLIIQQTAQHTAAWFRAINPIVPAETTALELDTGKTKVGDGVTPYNLLPYGQTLATDRVLIDTVFKDGPAPDLEFEVGVNETLEFEFATYHVSGAASLTATSNADTAFSAILQIGSRTSIVDSWSRKYHTVGATHLGTNSGKMAVGILSGNYSCNSGWGKIIRRSLGGMALGLAVDCRHQAYAAGVGDTTYENTLYALKGLPVDDSVIKCVIGIHPELRGFVKVRKNA